jgi:vacuolar-type H+-ATPase catalytic subunit A/Vma1
VKVAESPATEIVAAVHCGGAVYVGEIVRLDGKDDWLVVLGKADGLRVDEDDTIVEVEEELGIADGWVLVLMLVLVVIALDVDVVWLLVD